MYPLKLREVISEKEIKAKVAEIGALLTKKFKGEDLVAICVLKGSFVFYADLIREIDSTVICEFLGCSSYLNSHISSGEVKLTLDLNSAIKDKHVLLVEDIVDSGVTMAYLQSVLENRAPKSLTTVTLLHKPHAKKTSYKLDHIGFEIANDFVVGYGLDYQGNYRQLPHIAKIENLN